jgi:hypothetical protein
MALTYVDMSSVIEVQVEFFFLRLQHNFSPLIHQKIFKKFNLSKERLTSHGGGIGLSSGSPAYSGHTTSSGGRSSGLSSSQHGPSMHQPADFQPPYFPPPFHHPSTHQSPPQQQQQVNHFTIEIHSCFDTFIHRTIMD